MFNLMPRETVFFDLFEKSADNVQKGAQRLLDLMGNFCDLAYRAQEIKEIEHTGDKLTHDMIERMNKTFITPLDREDIHELACRLDDVIDLMDTATARMSLYKIEEPMADATALARVLVKATTIIRDAMPLLRTLSKKASVDALLKACIEVHTQENEGDRIEQHALASLFENGLDPITVIKWKDIFQDLEAATDRCEDVANAIESIVLKNA
jgi:uncharacterized protein